MKDENHALVWSWNPSREYTACLGYKDMFLTQEFGVEWWSKPLCKIKAPIKFRSLMWLALNSNTYLGGTSKEILARTRSSYVM